MQSVATKSKTSSSSSPCDLINSGTQLTVLPAAVPELLAALNNDELSYNELAQIIGQFPTIAARLIFLANSSWSAPVHKINSLDAACAKLGLTVVKSVSISIAIAAPFDPARSPAFQSRKFWATALLVADTAAWLARYCIDIPHENIPAIHTSALLHNLGILWLADNFPKETSAAFEALEASPEKTLATALSEACNANQCEIGGCLASAWNLPEPIVAAMQHHLDFHYSGNHWQTAILTGYAIDLLSAIKNDQQALPDDLRLQRLKISAVQRDEVATKLTVRIAKIQEMVEVLFS